jgi:hypothetical protein
MLANTSFSHIPQGFTKFVSANLGAVHANKDAKREHYQDRLNKEVGAGDSLTAVSWLLTPYSLAKNI